LDPGWIETLEVYYKQKVKSMFLNIIDHLVEDKYGSEGKFTIAEASFLERFYLDPDVN